MQISKRIRTLLYFVSLILGALVWAMLYAVCYLLIGGGQVIHYVGWERAAIIICAVFVEIVFGTELYYNFILPAYVSKKFAEEEETNGMESNSGESSN